MDALLYAMGPETEVIIKTLTVKADNGTVHNITAAELKKFNVVVSSFNAYFVPKINHLQYRIECSRRSQLHGETIETYVRSLYEIADNCDFHCMDEMIRDRLMTGVRDRDLEKELRLKGNDLTLAIATSVARNWEEVKSHMGESKTDKDKVQLEYFSRHSARHSRGGKQHSGNNNFNRGRKSSTHQYANAAEQPVNKKCSRCALSHPVQATCPAKYQKCLKCGIVGHFRAACRSKRQIRQHEIQTEQSSNYDDDSQYFLGSVQCPPDKPWTVNLSLRGSNTQFKADSGADVTVITRHTYQSLAKPTSLKSTNSILRSMSSKVQCDGKFDTTVKLNGQDYARTVYVVSSGTNLLSRSACKEMKILQYNEVGLNQLNVDPNIFSEAGIIKTEPITIKLMDGAVPYNVPVARRVPLPMVDLVDEELKRMEKNGVIQKITKPTDWCSPMVATMKKTGKVRICVDLKQLNKSVKREKYMLPTVTDIIGKLSGSVKFSSLDASGGYWQVPLTTESQELTTFITPRGRYCFKRLPYGITSASEIFQRKMCEILEGIDCIEIYQDDIIIHGRTDDEHDRTLKLVLAALKKAGVKLNQSKCLIGVREMNFLGHHISRDGVLPDANKVKAIFEMKAPSNVPSLRRFLGMVNFLGQYLPNLATVLKPLKDLLRKDSVWSWESQQQQAFSEAKRLVTESLCLAYYDQKLPTVVSADASSYGIGGVLMQDHSGKLMPVAYCSRTLSPAEVRYAQIEKEILASVWTCEKFATFIVGLKSFKLLTDHKPNVPLMSTRDLNMVPIRCQRLLMRMLRFNPEPEYRPGRDLVVADALSRQPITPTTNKSPLDDDVTAYVDSVVQG